MVNSNNGNLLGIYLILGTHGKQAMKEKSCFEGNYWHFSLGAVDFGMHCIFTPFQGRRPLTPGP